MSPQLPWREVRRAVDGAQVAAEVGLRAARERYKYGCVACDSTDALHVYQDGAKCYSCGWSGSVIDLAAVALRLTPAEACQRLAERYSIRADPVDGPQRGLSRRATQGPSREVLRCRAEVYGDAVHLLTLGAGGRAYLTGRGLNPELAAAHGVRSIESPSAWRELYRQLADRHELAALERAGLVRNGDRWAPWHGRLPALLLPYRSRTGQVEAARFRRMDDGPRYRYMTPLGGGASIPFGAEALDGPRPLRLVVAEGELDALALGQAGYDAIGLGGATPSCTLLAWVVDAVADATHLALWTDSDHAGDRAVNRLGAMLEKAYGAGWVRDHVERWRSTTDPAATLGESAQ